MYCPPYEYWYIYYIQGIVKTSSEKQLFLEHYIGNWIEEDTSFLFFTCASQGSTNQTNNKKFTTIYPNIYDRLLV